MSADDPFEAPPREPAASPDAMLQVDVDGFAGPLDLLLSLAQRQKVDLTRIAILPLAEQYLAFIETARALRIELAADMLVMAAWLAYLKSRLIAPAPDEEGEETEAMADALAFRLRRLDAMRRATDALFTRPQLGRDVFARGAPEAVVVNAERRWKGSLYELLAAYAGVRQAEIVRDMTMEKRALFSLVDARKVLERLVGAQAGSDWLTLETLLAAMPAHEEPRAVRASTFGATLEMAREGRIAVRQAAPFAPLFIRPLGAETREDDPSVEGDAPGG